MANYISKKVGKANDFIVNDLTIDGSSVMTGPVNKAWRSLILLHRATHGPTDHANKSNRKNDPAKVNGDLREKKKFRDDYVKYGKRQYYGRGLYMEFSGDKDQGFSVPIDTKVLDDLMNKKHRPENRNDVIIYNIMSNAKYSYVVLQNRPTTIDFKGETSWVSIKSMGRNLPMYHYTGAEDTLQFNVSWYANDPNHIDDVINKCRLLESWSKANGYKAAPPILNIQWGRPNDMKPSLFEGQLYILTSATYTLKNFSDSIRDKSNPKNIQIHNKGLYPMVATQELIFKRVSATNPEYEDIVKDESLAHTRGIHKNM